MTETISVEGRERRIGCLLIHGFGGNVAEVQPLAEFLTSQGLNVLCVSLKGHTGNRKDLKQCTYSDWIDSAREGLNNLLVKFDEIYLIGFSMGGLIAFQLALNQDVKAVITLNTPIFYWDLKRVAMNLADDFKNRRTDNLRRYIDSSRSLPFRALVNFRLLLSRTKPVLKNVRCPVFSAQALQDDTVNWRSAEYIYRNVRSVHKRLGYYDGAGHLILWSQAAGDVMKDILDFVSETI